MKWKVPTHQTTVWLSVWCADSRKPSKGLLLNDSSTKLTPCQHVNAFIFFASFYNSTLMIQFNVRDQNKHTCKSQPAENNGTIHFNCRRLHFKNSYVIPHYNNVSKLLLTLLRCECSSWEWDQLIIVLSRMKTIKMEKKWTMKDCLTVSMSRISFSGRQLLSYNHQCNSFWHSAKDY